MQKNLREIAHILGCHREIKEGRISHFTFDSREVRKGSLFFALKGERVDGHAFLKEAAKKGALGALVSKKYRGENYGLSLIPVQDVKTSLQYLGAKSYKKHPTPIVGITGTVGKTTTKEMIAALLSERYKVYKSPKSANSQISFPLNILNREKESEILVLEMGMSEPGELSQLVSIAPPYLGVLTGISLVHAENFKNLEEIAWAKAELFSSSHTQLAVLHHEALAFEPFKQILCPKLIYRLHGEGEDYTGKGYKKKFIIREKKIRTSIDLPFLESHFKENFLAATAVARTFQLSWEEIQRGALKIAFQPHRFQRIEKKGILFIDDSYNANPLAVKEALKNLPPPQKGGKKLAILGAMKDLGSFSEKCHREIGEFSLDFIDILFCYGKECICMAEAFEKGGKPVNWFSSQEKIIENLPSLLEPGDVVLLKGSNSLRMWEMLDRF